MTVRRSERRRHRTANGYYERRDAGELPKAAEELLPRFRTLAANECCDRQSGGACVRLSDGCLLRREPAHRCTWFEEAVLPADPALEAEADKVLSNGRSAQRMTARDRSRLRTICSAIDGVLDRQRWVGVDDITRATGLSRKGIERLLPAAIAELGLRKHRRGKEKWCLQ